MTSDRRITDEQLLAFAAGELDGATARRVEAMVATNPDIARTVALYRAAANRLATDDSVAPPRQVIDRAKRVAREQRAMELAPTWPERLVASVARLVFDSRVQPVLVRNGADDDRIQLSYETDEAEIDLQARRVPSRADRWSVIGQYAPDAPVSDVEVTLTPTGSSAPPASGRADERGVFTLEIDAGCYDLSVRHPGVRIDVPGVKFG